MNTTTLKDMIDISQLTGDWDYELEGNLVHLYRRRAEDGDGYPELLVVEPDDVGNVKGGLVTNSYPEAYGMKKGPYAIGPRGIKEVLTNIDNPFRYKLFLDAWLAKNPASISEKVLSVRVNVSERQIRKARTHGFMTGYLADKLVVKALGGHPSNVFGTPHWIAPESWPGETLEDLLD